ncbi:hypothetical protein A6J51_08690 [Neisseria meningitidis]|nr:hypothetical protein A6J51_08690 [Neisseria meningitidis]
MLRNMIYLKLVSPSEPLIMQQIYILQKPPLLRNLLHLQQVQSQEFNSVLHGQKQSMKMTMIILEKLHQK